MTYRAVYPTGEAETILSVPHYSFNWQIGYDEAQPLVTPKGTRIEVTAHFDNSPNNAYNPNPKINVPCCDQSWEEMMAAFMGVIMDKDTDPTMVVKRSVRSA